MVFDRQGHCLRSWGDGVFTRAHGMPMGPDATVFCTADGAHTVRTGTLEGKVLFTLGVPGTPAPCMSGEPFHRCPHVALDPRPGEGSVSAGYGHARVPKETPDGRGLFAWGEAGTAPGQCNIVHNMATAQEGWVYGAAREKHRMPVCDPQGTLATQWGHMARPSGLDSAQAGGRV